MTHLSCCGTSRPDVLKGLGSADHARAIERVHLPGVRSLPAAHTSLALATPLVPSVTAARSASTADGRFSAERARRWEVDSLSPRRQGAVAIVTVPSPGCGSLQCQARRPRGQRRSRSGSGLALMPRRAAWRFGPSVRQMRTSRSFSEVPRRRLSRSASGPRRAVASPDGAVRPRSSGEAVDGSRSSAPSDWAPPILTQPDVARLAHALRRSDVWCLLALDDQRVIDRVALSLFSLEDLNRRRSARSICGSCS